MSIHSREDVIRAAANILTSGKDSLSDEYIAAEFALRHALSPGHIEQLRQLVMSGPVWDGDVVSKSARDDLIALKLAGRAYFKGEDGYTVANYRGGAVFKAADFKG